MARRSSINDSGITQIVKALEKSNDKQELIADTLIGFNPVLQSPIVYDVIDNAQVFMAGVASTLIDISDTVNGIKAGINDVLSFFTGRQLQEEENRRELIDALNNLGEGRGSGPVPPPAPSEESGPAEWLMKLGAITGIGASFGVFAGFMGEMLKFLEGTRGIIGKMLTPVKWLASKGVAFFKSFAEGFGTLIGYLQDVFENSRLTKPLSDMIKYVRTTSDLGGGLSKIMKKVIEFFAKIGQNIAKFGKAFLWGSKLGVMLAKVFKAIAYPITIIMAAYATIMGAVKGFKEDGIMGAFKGGFTGLLVNLVGEIVDLVKDGVSWVAKMLGFENFSKMLDGFSFSELLGTGVNAIFDTIQYTWDYLTGLFSPDKLVQSFMDGGFAGLVAMIGGGILDMVKGAVSWLATILGAFDIANALDNFSIQDYLMKGVKMMIDFVSSSIDAIVTLFETAPQMLTDAIKSATDMANDFAKSVLKSVLPNAMEHRSMTDPLHWVGKAIPDSVYKFAGVQTPSEAVNSLNYDTGGKNPYENHARELEDADNRFKAEKLKVEDYLKSIPSNAGATLNESSTSTSNTPIIINNMGGNVTNTSMSSVNNNTSPFEPILAGSSMGFASF
jgi:hypothetical protein